MDIGREKGEKEAKSCTDTLCYCQRQIEGDIRRALWKTWRMTL